MNSSHFRQTAIYIAAWVSVVAAMLVPAEAQPSDTTGSALVHGYVRDTSHRALANATVILVHGTFEQASASPTETTHTDWEGHYRFAALRAGTYTLRAEMTGYAGTTAGSRNIAPNETTEIDLYLPPTKASELPGAPPATPAAAKPAAQAPEFFDEPQFTVAGVTQATSAGGHGSDAVLRTTEALARATVSLSKEAASPSPAISAATESSLRDALARSPKDAELHHRLGDVEEGLGKPLEAVREFQRAAELDPSELHLFDWGTELLTHRALEPATEVFTKGNHLFPKSARMLVALGVAWYARGSYDQANQCLVTASDLAPDDPTPYLFLGKMQSVETAPSELSLARLERFAQLQPDNALANYYYALSLWKQAASASDNGRERWARVEALLLNAVRLDPKLGAAQLQLGILYAERSDFSRAISAYQTAIEVSQEEVEGQHANPQIEETLEEAHYRLAQAYLRTGDKAQAKEQLQLHDQLSKKRKEEVERERREIQEFVISLQNERSGSPPRN